jgi:H+/Cl- antiporter ClcA
MEVLATARTTPRRLIVLCLFAAALGLAAGGAAWLLLHLIGLLTNLALFGRTGWDVPSFTHLHRSPRLVIVPVLGGLAVSLLARWSPEIRGHGIPEAMDAVLTNQSRIRPRTAFAKPVSAAIAIGTGGPFGAEGPIIVTGGAIGSLLGQLLPVSTSERKILLACGAAGGMAATFGAPLAAVVLAIELLLFEFSSRVFVPLVVSTALAGGVHSLLFGSGPLFAVPPHHYNGLDKLPLFAVLGVVCGLLAVVVTKGLFLWEAGYRRLPVPEFWHPPLGALAFGLVGLLQPRALGVGYDVIGDVLQSRLAIGTLVAIALAKVVAWWIALASGTSGGTLAPLLLVSGCVGSLAGIASDHVFPAAHVSPGGFALVAMAATFGASVRAPFTAIVFVFELTRDYEIILPLMLATVLAHLVATALLRESLMTEKLTRRGIRVASDYEADVLESSSVGDVMTTAIVTVPAVATVGEARRLLHEEGHGAFPILDGDGRCCGIVARQDLLDARDDDHRPVTDVASRDVVTVEPATSLLAALQLMITEDVGHLPVLRGDELVGICTRTDVLRARARRMELEQTQPGWRRPGRSHDTTPTPEGSARMRRYLVVANQTLGSATLLDALTERHARGPCTFHIVVPAVSSGGVYGQLLSAYAGEDSPEEEREAVEAAGARLATLLHRLTAADVPATGEVGPSDPAAAIERAMAAGSYDEIIVSTLPTPVSRWLRLDLPAHLARRGITCPIETVSSRDEPAPTG